MIDIGLAQLLVIITMAGTVIICGFVFICVDSARHKKPPIINGEKTIQKFMYIEDGSVDADELIEELERTNPEIKVIVYRSGSRLPYLVDVQSNDN